jgi:hypothetical protein
MKIAAAALGLLLVLGISAAPARAQSSVVGQIAGDKAASDKLHFGLSFGLSCSRLRGAEIGDRLGGFSLGLGAVVRLTGRLALAPEIVFLARKGLTEIPFVSTGDPALDPYFADPARSALVIDYLDVPVVLRWRLGRFHVGGGAFVGLLSKATERYLAEPVTGEELKHTREVTSVFRKADYGFVLEAAWTITKPRRGEGLVFHVRYLGGLADILRPASGVFLDILGPEPGPLRTSGLQVFLSFPFIR